MKITNGQRITDMPPGKSLVLDKIAAGGSLEARRLGSGAVMFYWRYTSESRTARVPIGHYDSSAPPKSLHRTTKGYSIAAALEAARSLAKTNADTPGGLRGAQQRAAEAETARIRETAHRQLHTLSALCSEYCGLLKKQGKSSWSEARNIFNLHLISPYPELACKPAAEVQKRDVVTALRRLAEAGKSNTARKLRSYLRAAYACALRADSDASLPSSFIEYGVTISPVEGTAAFGSRADKNPLSLDDLRAYWKVLQDEDGVIGAALRLHILSGAQRIAQLARLKQDGVVGDSLRLLDPKGKRSVPREHVVPLTAAMSREIQLLSKGGYLLSTNGGSTQMHPTSLSAWATGIAIKARIQGFQLKRVRSGVETILAAAGVPPHIRGQLQSHGIGGVQDRHYDAHEYLSQKRQALMTLHRLLTRAGKLTR